MFKSSHKDGDPGPAGDSVETFIGPSVKLEGNFTAEGDVVVEGILIGTMTTQGNIRVGPQASIEATIQAKNATIAGNIKGNVRIDNSLKVSSSASIHGDIKTASISIEEGAVVNGKISMRKDKTGKESVDEIMPEKIPAEKSKKKDTDK